MSQFFIKETNIIKNGNKTTKSGYFLAISVFNNRPFCRLRCIRLNRNFHHIHSLHALLMKPPIGCASTNMKSMETQNRSVLFTCFAVTHACAIHSEKLKISVSYLMTKPSLYFLKVIHVLDVYKEIYQKHCELTTVYKFSAKAKEVYEQFSDEVVEQMNRQLQEDIIIKDNMSKDRKIFIRCSILY